MSGSHLGRTAAHPHLARGPGASSGSGLDVGIMLLEPSGVGGVWEYSCHLGRALAGHGHVRIVTAPGHDAFFV